MVRSIMAVFAGMVVWAALWVPGSLWIGSLFPGAVEPGVPITNATLLLIWLVLSVVLSVLAGFVTGALARAKRAKHGLILGIVQLAIGLGVQISAWDLMPLWYHRPFLALLIPANVWGATLKK